MKNHIKFIQCRAQQMGTTGSSEVTEVVTQARHQGQEGQADPAPVKAGRSVTIMHRAVPQGPAGCSMEGGSRFRCGSQPWVPLPSRHERPCVKTHCVFSGFLWLLGDCGRSLGLQWCCWGRALEQLPDQVGQTGPRSRAGDPVYKIKPFIRWRGGGRTDQSGIAKSLSLGI